MNGRQREQVGRIVSLASSTHQSNLAEALAQVCSSQSKAGRLQSGSTILVAIAEVRRATDLLLSELLSKAAAVSRAPAAFDEVASAFRHWFEVCEVEIRLIVETVGSRGFEEVHPLVWELTAGELQKFVDQFDQRLQIERYDFETSPAIMVKTTSTPEARSGGRPPAAFWDDMWAAIAGQLYEGTLAPKTQADLERAMADWISANGHDAATSTIRARARRLAGQLKI